MKAAVRVLAVLILWMPAAHAAAPVVTTTPTGDYRLAWLQLEKGGLAIDDRRLAPIDVPLFLGLREGRAVVAWFVHPAMTGGRVVWLDTASLKADRTTFAGGFAGRTSLHWGSKNVHDYAYQIDATIEGNTIAGAYTARFAGDDGSKAELSGKLTGRLMAVEEAHKENGLTAGKNWPHYFGDGASLAGPPCQSQLIDNLSLAKPVWKSEACIPTAYGSAPDSRYYDRAGRTDNGGGSSSPLVVDGRVYQFFYYPRGPVGLDKAYGKYTDETDLLAKARALFPKREIQQRAVVNHFRTQADEILVCLDGATGQTLWRTLLPQRGNNYQTHKHRGHFPVALVANGVIYQPGTTGRLYALDAASGKLIWEYPDANPEPYVAKQGGVDCHAPSPVLAGNVVAFAASKGVVGVDAGTGRKLWERPLWTRSSLLAWRGPSRTLLLATDRQHEKNETFSVALDPADGTIVWLRPVEFLNGYTFPLLAGDRLIGYSLQKDNVRPGKNDGLAVLHAYRVSESGLERIWTTPPLGPVIDTVAMAIAADHVYVALASETLCLSAATGERIAGVKDVGGARTQTACVADDRLFLQPEGRHGSQSFFLLDADPKNFRVLGSGANASKVNHGVASQWQWRPPHTWTTAYANQPIVYPVVDGRIFIRGLDAIYCYDLRKTTR